MRSQLGSSPEAHAQRGQALVSEAEKHLDASQKAHARGDCFVAVEQATRALAMSFAAREHIEAARPVVCGESVTLARQFADQTMKNYRDVAGDCICQPERPAAPSAPRKGYLEIEGAHAKRKRRR